MKERMGFLQRFLVLTVGLACVGLVRVNSIARESTRETFPTQPARLSNSDFMETQAQKSDCGFCNFSKQGGSWTVAGVVGEEEGAPEHIIHFAPNSSEATSCRFKRFNSDAAWRCLAGKQILMYGNSNTRTLYIALEALLRNKPMTSRVAAKQLCDNSRTNHSCWATIEGREGGRSPIQMQYVSYTGDLYHDKLLEDRLRQTPMVQRGSVDFIVGNSGLNMIQLQDDRILLENHKTNVPKLRRFVESLSNSSKKPIFVWHTTTPVCENQPHFKRYRYNAKHWRYRTLDQINAVIAKSNEIASRVFSVAMTTRVVVIDGWAMLMASAGLCQYFEDPLHHRFLDREIVQIFLNEVCC